jgi:multidrug efflux pump subunit AcrB
MKRRISLVLLCLLAGCARFKNEPISPSETADALEHRTLDNPALKSFLETNLHRAFTNWPAVGATLMKTPSAVGAFAIRHRLAIAFISIALCLSGIYAAFNLPSSVFPQTDFPRVVILVDNGVMPADEMMATVTRPIQEVMKDIPDAVRVRSITGRGSAEISVFFNWKANMVQAELHVDSRLSQIRAALPDIEWEFPGILGDLIGDMTSEPDPIEVKLFSTDIEFLKTKAPEVADQIEKVKGVVDVKDGLVYAGTSLNVVSFLGAIIGVGIVAKNGILMLDFVEHLRSEGATLEDALVRSGHRRLRPVLMTSMAAAFGMLPLAYGVGSGADMLKPLAIAVIGALCISVLLSLVATPAVYYLMRRMFGRERAVSH